jgi:PiT family inorganic phosphate transporter
LILLLIYILSFLLVAVVSGNNLPVCCGPIISSGIVGKKTGIAMAILGYAAGYLIEGQLLRTGLLALMPVHSAYMVALSLAVTLVIFIIAHLLRVPHSLSVTFTAVILGLGYGFGSAINGAFVTDVLVFWIISALFAGVATIAIMRLAFKTLPKVRVWVAVSRMKLLLIIASFFSAFVLGANTIGFVFASTSGIINPLYGALIAIVAIISGSVLLSSGELKRMGNEILPLRYLNALVSQAMSVAIVQVATMFSIPASNTQTFTASLYGAGLSYKTRLLRKRPAITIIAAWISTALVSFALGFLLIKLF